MRIRQWASDHDHHIIIAIIVTASLSIPVAFVAGQPSDAERAAANRARVAAAMQWAESLHMHPIGATCMGNECAVSYGGDGVQGVAALYCYENSGGCYLKTHDER